MSGNWRLAFLDPHAYWDRERQEGPTDMGPSDWDGPPEPESDEAYEARVLLRAQLGSPYYRQRRERAILVWKSYHQDINL